MKETMLKSFICWSNEWLSSLWFILIYVCIKVSLLYALQSWITNNSNEVKLSITFSQIKYIFLSPIWWEKYPHSNIFERNRIHEILLSDSYKQIEKCMNTKNSPVILFIFLIINNDGIWDCEWNPNIWNVAILLYILAIISNSSTEFDGDRIAKMEDMMVWI